MAIELESLSVQQHIVISPDEWFAVFRPIFPLSDGSTLITILHTDPANEQNGVWRLAEDGNRTEQIYRFTAEESSLIPQVIDVSADGSTALLAEVSYDSTDASPYVALDLISGETRTLPGPDSDTESSTIAGYPQFVSTSTDIAYPSLDPDIEGATINLDLDDPTILIDDIDCELILGRFQWSESNLILLRGTDGSATIYTMQSESADATPAPPCSCTPPEGN